MPGVDLPPFAELPRDLDGLPTAWKPLADAPDLGMVAMLTPERARRAVEVVRDGRVFPLDLPLGAISPPFFQRRSSRHSLVQRSPVAFDDSYDDFYPQAGSQWDALAHVAAAPGRFFGDASAEEIRSGARTIGHWAEHGIVARGVLLDLGDLVAARGGPGRSLSISVDDLEAARETQGVAFSPGDLLMIRTGFLEWYARLDPAQRASLAEPGELTAVGLEHSERMAEYLWDRHLIGVASDTVAVEVWPPEEGPGADPYGKLHAILIGRFGMALGELWRLDALAAHCRDTGRFEVLVTSAPLNAPGSGSPANALAIT